MERNAYTVSMRAVVMGLMYYNMLVVIYIINVWINNKVDNIEFECILSGSS